MLGLRRGEAGRPPGRDVLAQVVLGLGQDQVRVTAPEPGPQLAEVLLDRLGPAPVTPS